MLDAVVRAVSLGGNVIFRHNNGLLGILRVGRRGPNGNGALVRVSVRSIQANSVIRAAVHPSRGIRRIGISGGGTRCLCSRNGATIFVSVRACRRCRVDSRRLARRGGCLIRGVRIRVSFINDRLINVRLPAAIILAIRRARPVVGNTAVSNNNGPTAVDANLIIGIPTFVGGNSRVVIGAVSNDCGSQTWLVGGSSSGQQVIFLFKWEDTIGSLNHSWGWS